MSCLHLDSLTALRAHLARDHALLQVKADSDGNRRWMPADAGDAAPAGGQLPDFSAKALLFRERENLFTFDGSVFREQRPQPRPTVLFGVSACDLAAIHYQDRFFADDPWYRARRESLLLVGIDCLAPCEGGFCPLTDSGPFVRDGQADLVLHADDAQAGGGWLLFVQTARGERALAGFQGAVGADSTRATLRARREPGVVSQFADDGALRAGIAALNAGTVAAAQWQRLGVECITCSGCSNVCPTCSCFATRQESGAAGGVGTVRFWDSCLFEGFQREASGHNTSLQPGARIARFWSHKFGDDFAARFGHYTCVGCGRCDRACPSGIGAKATLRRLGGQQPGVVTTAAVDAAGRAGAAS